MKDAIESENRSAKYIGQIKRYLKIRTKEHEKSIIIITIKISNNSQSMSLVMCCTGTGNWVKFSELKVLKEEKIHKKNYYGELFS